MAAGAHSLLAFWAGGAARGPASPAATAGFQSALAFWLGGAGHGAAEPAPLAGFRSELALWLGGAGLSAGFPTQFSGFEVIYAGVVRPLSLVAEANAPAGMGGVLKMRIAGQTYACYLVEIGDDHASNLRVKTTTGIKSIRLKT